MTEEINLQKQRIIKLNNLYHEERKLKKRIHDIYYIKRQLIDEIKSNCKHKHITAYREYTMHRAEYSYKCEDCQQMISFDEYCSLDKPIVKDVNL